MAILAASTAISNCSQAGTQPAPTQEQETPDRQVHAADVNQAVSGQFTLDNEHTHIIWQVDRFGFTKTVGSFIDITGTLHLDEAAPEKSKVEASLSLSGLRSDLLEREDIIRGEYWLDAASFPEITFRSETVSVMQSDGDGQSAKVTGQMTLKGVTAPLELMVNLNKSGTDPVTKKRAYGFTATGEFQRSDFGVKTALGPIGNNVSFQIEALAIEAGE